MQKFNLVNIVFFIFHITVFGNEYNIKSFGAIGDGVTINTIAIQKAIDKAHADGGGMVVIPAGKFVSGSIILKNRVGLHLDKRAILLGSVDFKDYIRLYKWMALILAENASNISISGKGTIDGRGAELGLHVDSLLCWPNR